MIFFIIPNCKSI